MVEAVSRTTLAQLEELGKHVGRGLTLTRVTKRSGDVLLWRKDNAKLLKVKGTDQEMIEASTDTLEGCTP